MYRPLPGRTEPFIVAGFTLLAALSLLASPEARAAVTMPHRLQVSDLILAGYETGEVLARRPDASLGQACVKRNGRLLKTCTQAAASGACRAATLVSRVPR